MKPASKKETPKPKKKEEDNEDNSSDDDVVPSKVEFEQDTKKRRIVVNEPKAPTAPPAKAPLPQANRSARLQDQHTHNNTAQENQNLLFCALICVILLNQILLL